MFFLSECENSNTNNLQHFSKKYNSLTTLLQKMPQFLRTFGTLRREAKLSSLLVI